MYAVIQKERDGRIKVLRTCRSRESVIIACQLEKELVPSDESSNVLAVVMDDGGWMEQ